MKNNAITRIIIFSIVIVILLGILLTGLGVGMFTFIIHTDNDTSGLSASDGNIPAENIQNIEIEWAAGSIHIQTADTDSISFKESGVNIEENRMVWKSSGNTLSIYYSKPALQIGFFSTENKDLTLIVPKEWVCKSLTLDVASSDISIMDLHADELNIDSASGECELTNCTIDDLDIDTASGSIYYEGYLNTLDCDAASASFVGTFTNVPRKIQMDSASGDLDITLPETCGFRVTMDALSGRFQSDFPTDTYNNSYIYGDESCQIDFDGASGSVRIRKAE